MLLSPRQAYARWAAAYDAETAVSALENAVVEETGVETAGRRVLDVGCGTGRRLAPLVEGRARARAALALGVDLTPEMLARRRVAVPVASADVRALPFVAASFDVVWCRLVIGHVAELAAAYRELGRVCAPGGRVIVTDFHPDAVAAGHRRTFRDAGGEVHEIEHHVHDLAAHDRAGRAAGLALHSTRDGRVDERIRPFYVHRGDTRRGESGEAGARGEARGDARGAGRGAGRVDARGDGRGAGRVDARGGAPSAVARDAAPAASTGEEIFRAQRGLALVLALVWERAR